jgi:hypothetical protein
MPPVRQGAGFRYVKWGSKPLNDAQVRLLFIPKNDVLILEWRA